MTATPNATASVCATSPVHSPSVTIRPAARPLSADTGLMDIKAIAERGDFGSIERKGSITPVDVKPDYIEHLLSYIDPAALKPLKVVVNAGNGGAGSGSRR